MKRMLKGSFTIEATMIIPMILLIVCTAITILFYWHDRIVLKGIVYETTVVASERGSLGDQELKDNAEKFIRGKLLWFPGAIVTVEKTNETVTVTARASHRGLVAEAEGKMPITCPEKTIRRKEYIDEDILQK